jgi:hypothetical protein
MRSTPCIAASAPTFQYRAHRWTVTGKHGHACVMCDGHALDARKRLENARAGLGEGVA